jgi:hypothetical protein
VYHAYLYSHAVARTEEIFTEEMRQLGEDAKTKVRTEVRVKPSLSLQPQASACLEACTNSRFNVIGQQEDNYNNRKTIL